MRWVLRVLLAVGSLCALALVGAAALLWMLGSEQGTAWLLGKIQARANGAVEIGRVEGSLLGGLTLERVVLRWPRDELEIDALRLSWAVPVALVGTIAFTDVHAGRIAYRRLPPSGAPAPAASVKLDLPFAVEVRDATADSVALATGEQTLMFGRTTAAARLAGGRLTLAETATETSGFVLSGSAELDFAERVRLTAAIDWSQPQRAEPFAGRLTVEGTLPVLRVHHELTAPAAIVADGELTLDNPARVELAVEWRDLALPRVSGAESRRGRLTLAGSIEAYRFDGAGEIRLAGIDAAFDLRGGGAGSLLTVEALTLASSHGTLSAAGDLALDTRAAELQLAVSDVDPSALFADWPGRLTGTARLRGALEPAVAAELEGLDLRGELRGQPVAASGALAYAAPDRWRLAGVRLESAASSVALDGELGSAADAALALSVDASIAALEPFAAELRGSLRAALQIGGSRAAPSASGSIEGRGLGFGDYSAAQLRVAGEAGLAPGDRLALDIEVSELARGSIAVAAARARLEGTAAAHRVLLDATAPRWEARAVAAGGLRADEWSGSIESLDIDEQALGNWSLLDPASVSVGARGAAVRTICMQHDSAGRWCAELALQGSPEDRLVVSAQNFDLQALQPLLPAQLMLAGVYQLSASFADLSREPRGSLAVSGGSTQVHVGFNERQTFSTVLEDLTVGATLTNGQLEMRASVMSRESGRVSLQTRIADLRERDSAISGELNVAWPDLAFLSLLTPDVGDIAGGVEADMTVAGTLDRPQVEGAARLRDGRVAVPEWGIVIERIDATATSPDGSELEFRASGWVGDGEVTLTGSTELDPGAGWPTTLSLRGESIQAVQLPDVEIYVSPDLTLTAQLPNIDVTGTVHVPRARIELSQLPAAAIAPSPDAVVHGTELANELRSLLLTSDILVTLGDAVEYLGLGLTTTVAGELRMRRDANRVTTATGSVTLTGTYSAYGQTLQLERGQLLFNGPLDDPTLDVRAVRTIDTTRAGVELIGTVKAPRTRVFSDPAMSEADALSYLLLGRPVTGTGGAESATLQSAALAMGLQQALPVVQRIGQSLGLDEFTVQTTDTDAGALMAGKYLSPRVFIRYSYGLFNRIGGLLLRFRINERVSIETRSGDQKSMDLLYTVEKD